MPWVEAHLRGQKVFARARDDGSLAADGGRVEIRYKKEDARAYRAAAGNLEVDRGAKVLPDDHCVSADFVPSPAAAKAAKKAAAKDAAIAALDRHEATGPGATGAAARGWIAYTDGACSGNPGPAGSGVVLIAPDGKISEGYESLGTATNNIAELTGILRALERVPADAEGLAIHTDSQYAIGVLTKGWKAKTNQELIATIRAALARWGRKVRLVYVPGHAGVPMNERADELAREAIRTGRTRLPEVAPAAR